MSNFMQVLDTGTVVDMGGQDQCWCGFFREEHTAAVRWDSVRLDVLAPCEGFVLWEVEQ